MFKDFTTVLSEHGSTRARLLACLREVYDGSYTRRLGTMGGRTFTWEGKAGFLGAVTGAVDNVDFGLLGERFVYYRLPAQDENAEFLSGLAAIENVGRQGEIRRERAEAVGDFIAGLSRARRPAEDDVRTRRTASSPWPCSACGAGRRSSGTPTDAISNSCPIMNARPA